MNIWARKTETVAENRIYTNETLGIAWFALAIFLYLFVSPSADVHAALPTFPLSSDSPTLSLLLKIDYAMYTKRDVKIKKNFLRFVRRYWLLDILATLWMWRLIFVISRLIRAENTRWKSTAVVRLRFRVIYMHDCETILIWIQNMPRKYYVFEKITRWWYSFCRKNDFAEICKNLDRFENNFVGPSK